MTRTEFERSRMAIEQETFQSTCRDPFTYGIDRNTFVCQKFQRLIDLAEKAPGQAAKIKHKQWKQQLERSLAAKGRFEKLRAETKIIPSLSTIRSAQQPGQSPSPINPVLV